MKNLYRQEWSFFKTNLVIKFGWLVILCALFTELLYFSFMQQPEIMEKVMKAIIERFQEEGLIGLREKDPLMLSLKIFYINLRTTFLLTLLGFVPFFIGTLLFLFSLPVLLGVSLAATITKGFDFFTFFKLTAPHGVLEMVAVFYGVSIGVYLSKEITKKLFPQYRPASASFADLIKRVIKSYPLVIIPLLALAAMIEGFVTPLLK